MDEGAQVVAGMWDRENEPTSEANRGRKLRVGVIYLWSTAAISVLTIVSSTMGIFVASTYARDAPAWAMQARGQDLANSVAVLVLLVGGFAMVKSSARGFQIWVGALLFLIYGFVIYAFASAFNDLFLVYVATLGILVYTFLGGVVRSDFAVIRKEAPTKGRARVALGLLLILLAFGFYLLWLSQDIPALVAGTVPLSVTQAGLLSNPVHVLDLGIFLPAFILTGISLLRNGTLGHVFAPSLLVFGLLTMLGIAFIIF